MCSASPRPLRLPVGALCIELPHQQAERIVQSAIDPPVMGGERADIELVIEGFQPQHDPRQPRRNHALRRRGMLPATKRIKQLGLHPLQVAAGRSAHIDAAPLVKSRMRSDTGNNPTRAWR